MKNNGYKISGYRYKNKCSATWGDANDIAGELSLLEIRTPQKIVEFAKDSSTHLHKIFYSIKDKDAADIWRLDEARRLCQNMVTIYTKKDEDDFCVKTFESIKIDMILEEEDAPASRMYIDVVSGLRDNDSRLKIFDEVIKLQNQATAKMVALRDIESKLIP